MADFRPFSPCWGDISFTEAPRTTARCYAGAIFLSRSPFGATARARGVAWLRCPRVAGPGRTTRRRTEPHASTPGPTGMEGAGGSGGPGCGAGGRWRGLAGLRGDAPSEARGADGSRAGRRPRAHQAARPNNTPLGARNTSGATRHLGTTKPPSPTGGRAGGRRFRKLATENRPAPQGPGGSDNQRERVSAGSRRCPDHRDRFPDGRSKCQALKQCPWRFLPCAGLRRRRWRSGWSIRQHLRRWFPHSRPGSGSVPADPRIPGCRCR